MDQKLAQAAEFIKKLTAENQSLNLQLQSTQTELKSSTDVLNKIKEKTRELLVQHKQDMLAKDFEIEKLTIQVTKYQKNAQNTQNDEQFKLEMESMANSARMQEQQLQNQLKIVKEQYELQIIELTKDLTKYKAIAKNPVVVPTESTSTHPEGPDNITNSLNHKLQDLSQQLEQSLIIAADFESKVKELESIKTQLEVSENNLNELNVQITQLKESHKQEIQKLNSEISIKQQEFEETIKELTIKLNTMSVEADNSKYQEQIDQLHIRNQEKTNELNSLKNDLAITTNKHNDSVIRLEEKHTAEIKNYQSELAKKETLISELQLLLKQVEVKSTQKIQSLQSENKELSTKHQTNQDVIIQTQGELKVLKSDLSKINDYKSKISLLEQQLNELKLDNNLKNNINDSELTTQLTLTISNLKMENEQLIANATDKNQHVVKYKHLYELKMKELQALESQIKELQLELEKALNVKINTKQVTELQEKLKKYEMDIAHMIDRDLVGDMILKYIKSDKKQDIILIMKDMFKWTDEESPINITNEWVRYLESIDK